MKAKYKFFIDDLVKNSEQTFPFIVSGGLVVIFLIMLTLWYSPQPNAAAPVSIVCPSPELTFDLKRGYRDLETGGQVSSLQRFLWQYRDYYDWGMGGISELDFITGVYTTRTEDVVKKFQTLFDVVSQGTPEYGKVYALTRDAILDQCQGVTLLSPSGGETWHAGETVSIQWSTGSYPTSAGTVELYLIDTRYSSETTVGSAFFANTLNTGSIDLRVPESLGELSGGALAGNSIYKLKIIVSDQNSGLPDISDISDAPFSIVGSSLSPNPSPVQSIAGYVVRPVYFIPNDMTPPVDFDKKMQTATLMIQEYFSDKLDAHGFGQKNFNLELDAAGSPRIFLIRGQYNAAYYLAPGEHPHAASYKVQRELEQIFDEDRDLVWVMIPWGAWHGMRSPNPYQRGGYAFTGDFLPELGTTRANQLQIFCDTTQIPLPEGGMRTRGQVSSISLGGAAHEIGHALGAQHFNDLGDIMSVGFHRFSKHFNDCYSNDPGDTEPGFDRGHAVLMDASPFFRSVLNYTDNTLPSIEINMPNEIAIGSPIPISLTVSDTGSGLGFLFTAISRPGSAVTVRTDDLRGRQSPYQFSFEVSSADMGVGGQSIAFHLFDQASNRTITGKPFAITDPSTIPPEPDLAIAGLRYTLPTITTDPVEVSVVVHNAGSKISGASVLRLDLGTEAKFTLHDIPSLAPGGTHSILRSQRLDRSKSHLVKATVDYRSQVVESNENNNTATVTIPVR